MSHRKNELPQAHGATPSPVRQSGRPQVGGTAQMRKTPSAPPVYRPQPTPTVLQTKRASQPPTRAGQPPRQPVAPHVYRPEAKKLVQPKMAASAHQPLTPSPVYRPQPAPKVLQTKIASGPPSQQVVPSHRPPVAPPRNVLQQQTTTVRNALDSGNKVVQKRSSDAKSQTISRHPALSSSIQRTEWSWINGAWVAQGAVFGQAPPARVGTYPGDYEDDGIDAAPAIPLKYDVHGDKHFTGIDSQWDDAKASVNTALEVRINAVMDQMQANLKPNAKGVTTFYLQETSNANVGFDKSAGKKTKTYMIQIDYEATSIGYHGYPCETNQKDGLRHSKYGKVL